ncbi:MIP family Ig-specific serine endopeptidase [Mycoplasma bradburyae]|uniref:DUF31 family protein n=1 Tax=Mycoplasma bradburyae TaxID=2963128 RepID=A0ABT5GA58_9MOLU|nr:DUF31 family protein [Mycoplasma bradburyae]MDC4181842.1 DUF31 family protein [Mycoplasma bradburyae]UTS70141.1 DUF31 family protein [Mycoplasma bradburyae]
MSSKNTWFKLLCGLSAISFVVSSCRMEYASSSKTAIDAFSALKKEDIIIDFKVSKSKTLPSQINKKNYFNYINFSIADVNSDIELNKFNFDATGFQANDQRGELSFKLNVSLINDADGTNSEPKEFNLKITELKATGTSSNTDTRPTDNSPSRDESSSNNNNVEDANPSTETGDNPGLTPSITPGSGGGVPPTFPRFPNGFPIGPTRSSVLEKNSYPSYVDRFTVVDKKKIYEEIYDRTFSIKPGTLIKSGQSDLLLTDQGTGWVLDYAKNQSNNNQLKLFIATNLHVIGNYGNTNDKSFDEELSYSDPTGVKPGGFAIGKSSKTPSFEDQHNKLPASELKEKVGNMIYYANVDKEDYATSNKKGDIENRQTTAFSNPKIVFAAVDYLDDTALNQYKPQIDRAWESWKEQTRNKINNANGASSSGTSIAQEEIDRLNKLMSYSGKISFYTDFGILELNVDLSKADETLKGWINKSTTAVDNYVNRIKMSPGKIPNYDSAKGNFFPTLDYMSKNLGLAPKDDVGNYGLDTAKNIYIAGYPFDNGSNSSYWMQNNPIERYGEDKTSKSNRWLAEKDKIANKDLFAVEKGGINTKTYYDINNLQIYTKLWNRPFIDRYGIDYQSKFSSLYFGASGSVAYNEFGQIVGIYHSLDVSSISYGDVLGGGAFASFVQAADIPTLSNSSIINYGYNLIDNNGFPHQTRSYRSNLKKMYPNGFTWPSTSGTDVTNSTNKVTAIFPSGY